MERHIIQLLSVLLSDKKWVNQGHIVLSQALLGYVKGCDMLLKITYQMTADLISTSSPFTLESGCMAETKSWSSLAGCKCAQEP